MVGMDGIGGAVRHKKRAAFSQIQAELAGGDGDMGIFLHIHEKENFRTMVGPILVRLLLCHLDTPQFELSSCCLEYPFPASRKLYGLKYFGLRPLKDHIVQ
jgi:hypothetical protein